jgi:membrane fusion protein (multidrug efflux system)
MTTTERAPNVVDTASGNTGPGAGRKVGSGKMFTRVIAASAAALLVIAGGVEGTRYWKVGQFIEATDDAYVKADSTIVAPKVSGYIANVIVEDNQSVKAGQLLARIDDRDLRTALDDATANVAAATAAIAHLDAQIAAQGSLIRQADAGVTAAAAALSLSQRNDVRRQTMAEVGYGSVEQADSASTAAKEGRANLERLQAAAVTARQQIGIFTTQRQQAEAQLARTEAAKHQAELNLSYTGIVAPIDGTVAARSVRMGQYVQAGTQLMALVPLKQVYVVANFKETQLTQVQPGQLARVRIDTFPEHDLVGHVDTIAPASGMEFSLLPPDNATGNFTKIVQRIPVKIVFPLNETLAGRIRPGMSVEAQIDTRAQAPNQHQHQNQIAEN